MNHHVCLWNPYVVSKPVGVSYKLFLEINFCFEKLINKIIISSTSEKLILPFISLFCLPSTNYFLKKTKHLLFWAEHRVNVAFDFSNSCCVATWPRSCTSSSTTAGGSSSVSPRTKCWEYGMCSYKSVCRELPGHSPKGLTVSVNLALQWD